MAYTFGTVFSDSWAFYKKNLKNLLILTAIVFIVTALSQVFIYQTFMSEYLKFADQFSLEAEQMAGVSDDAGIGIFLMRTAMLYFSIALPWMILYMLIFMAIQACVIYSTKSKGKLSEIIGKGLGYYGKLILLEIFRGLCMLALIIFPAFFIWLAIFVNMPWIIIIALLLFIPIFIFGIYWYFAEFCLILDNSKVLDCLKNSTGLVKGRWWKTLGYLILISLIVGGIGYAFNMVIGAFFPSQSPYLQAMQDTEMNLIPDSNIIPMGLNMTNIILQVVLSNAVSSIAGIFMLIFLAHLFFAMKANPVKAAKTADAVLTAPIAKKKATAPARKKS